LSNLNDKASSSSSADVQAVDLEAAEEEQDYDIPPEIEEVLGLLLDGLRDKDTIVRWSSAKGVGRITERLPRELGDEVVQGVIDLFSFTESDGVRHLAWPAFCRRTTSDTKDHNGRFARQAWHGGCLALGELARRGLLLTHRLADIMPLVTKALLYDVKKGTRTCSGDSGFLSCLSCVRTLSGAHSIGAHVRDAACYVVWAFARAYDPLVMAPHVVELAPTVIITALFDRCEPFAYVLLSGSSAPTQCAANAGRSIADARRVLPSRRTWGGKGTFRLALTSSSLRTTSRCRTGRMRTSASVWNWPR
jgi:hypothetical protein